MLMKMKVNEFVAELASASPAPGGGTIAALVGSFGAGLGSMVCQLTIGNSKYLDVQDTLIQFLNRLCHGYENFLILAEKDTAAFNKVMEAYKLPKNTEKEIITRKKKIAESYKEAIKIPMQTAEEAINVLEILSEVAKYGNSNALSDCGVAIECLKTSAKGALMNVAINLESIKIEADILDIKNKQKELKNRLEIACKTANKELQKRFIY